MEVSKAIHWSESGPKHRDHRMYDRGAQAMNNNHALTCNLDIHKCKFLVSVGLALHAISTKFSKNVSNPLVECSHRSRRSFIQVPLLIELEIHPTVQISRSVVHKKIPKSVREFLSTRKFQSQTAKEVQRSKCPVSI